MHLLRTRGSALSLRLVWELHAVLVRAGGQVPVVAAPGDLLGCLLIGWRLSGSRHAEEEHVPKIAHGLVSRVFMASLGDSLSSKSCFRLWETKPLRTDLDTP